MAINPIYNILDPDWFDFQHASQPVTFKPGFARVAQAGERVGDDTASKDDLIVTNAGGVTFLLTEEADKRRWKLSDEPQTYREQGRLVTGHMADYAGPPVAAVRAGESGYMHAPKGRGMRGTMVRPADYLIRERGLYGGLTHYAMSEAQFNAATTPAPKAPAPQPPRGFQAP